MRILHLSTHDNAGGAARAAYRLHDGLKRLGQDSRMFVALKTSTDESVTRFDLPARFSSRFARTVRQNLASRGHRGTSSLFSGHRTQYGKGPWLQCPQADLMNLHWVSGFVDYDSFFRWLPGGVPLVWTLHDMNPFTGGCHYDGGCGRFSGACGACPQLQSDQRNDFSHRTWSAKRDALFPLPPKRLHVVAPSKWMAQQAAASSLLGRFPISVIPYGLDTEVFKPQQPSLMREILGIPREAKVIGFVAHQVEDPRKGIERLFAALRHLRTNESTFLLSLGSGKVPPAAGFSHVHVASVQDDRMLSALYSAMDVFSAPSLQDNLPNTMLEAIACGTPVVAFNVGGIPDAVRDNVTGILVAADEPGEMGEALDSLLFDPKRRAVLSKNSRAVAVSEYDISVQASKYLELYQACL